MMHRLRQKDSKKKHVTKFPLFGSGRDGRYMALDDDHSDDENFGETNADMEKQMEERQVPDYGAEESQTWAVFKEALIHSMDSNLGRRSMDEVSETQSMTEAESSSDIVFPSHSATTHRGVMFADEIAGQPLTTVHYYNYSTTTSQHLHSLAVYERVSI